MRTNDFDYDLPEELIAQAPLPRRDASRLMVVNRGTGEIQDRRFIDLKDHLRPGDLLVLNDSRVVPARLRGRNARSGGAFELLLLEETARNEWWAMLRPGRRARPGTRIALGPPGKPRTEIEAVVLERNAEGHGRLRFEGCADILEVLNQIGEVPLPPYIGRKAGTGGVDDRSRYQTVYARPPGSVAAPTAGLHFTEPRFAELKERGVNTAFITLHVGLATFAPVKVESLADHVMHEERFEVDACAAGLIADTRRRGGRIVAVGTTSVRVLESVATAHDGVVVPGGVKTRIFIHPPFTFRVVDAMITNFHLPRSTLLMLVSAFAAPGSTCGTELALSAYRRAVQLRYRFFSYGDAMLLL